MFSYIEFDIDAISKLIPKFWPFLIQLLAFLVLFVAVFFLAYKPVKKFLKKRNDYVINNIEESKKNELASIEKLKQADETLAQSYKDAKVILADAKKDALKERSDIIAKAKEDARKEKLKAEEDIKLAVKKSQDDIHKEMVDVALLASEKILQREVNKIDNQKRINDFIKDLDK